MYVFPNERMLNLILSDFGIFSGVCRKNFKYLELDLYLEVSQLILTVFSKSSQGPIFSWLTFCQLLGGLANQINFYPHDKVDNSVLCSVPDAELSKCGYIHETIYFGNQWCKKYALH